LAKGKIKKETSPVK